jgi:hypothetical protein
MVERCENRLAPDLKTLTNEGKVSRWSGIHQAKRTRYEILCLTAVGYARFYSRSPDAVIRVYNEAGNVTKFGRTVFTVVEIMIVVAVMALLVAMTIPGFLRTGKRRKSVEILNDFRLIDSAVAANGSTAPC